MMKTYLFFDKTSKFSIGVMDMDDTTPKMDGFVYIEATQEQILKFNSGVVFKVDIDSGNIIEDTSLDLIKKKQQNETNNKTTKMQNENKQ